MSDHNIHDMFPSQSVVNSILDRTLVQGKPSLYNSNYNNASVDRSSAGLGLDSPGKFRFSFATYLVPNTLRLVVGVEIQEIEHL